MIQPSKEPPYSVLSGVQTTCKFFQFQDSVKPDEGGGGLQGFFVWLYMAH